MVNPLVSSDCSYSNITYVALATTLLPSELQPYASAAGLCHLRITSTNDENCLIQVAALPHRLHDITSFASRRVFTVWVDPEQLEHALPWDRTLQNLPTFEVRERLEEEAQMFPFPLSETDDTTLSTCAKPVPLVETTGQEHQTMTLIPLPELFVSCETVNETVTEVPEPPFDGSALRLNRWTRLVWLHAALAMVRRQLAHTRQVFFKLDVLLDKVIAEQRHLHQSLVSANAVYVGKRLVGWRLRIALPMMEVLA
jgi:hypothetical protein